MNVVYFNLVEKMKPENRKLMNAIALIVVGLLLICQSIAQAQNKGDFTVPLSDPSKRAKVKVHLNSGSITVKGTARKDILVTYDAEDHKDEEDHDDDEDNEKGGLKRIAGGSLDIEVTESQNSVSIKSDSWNQGVNMVVEVPIGVDLQAHTYNDGELVIRNIQGVVELTNYNGEITAENISGSVVATTYNGDVKVTFDKVTDNTPMSFSTYNGDIDLTFPAAIKASLKMKTERGDVYTDFDMNIAKRAPVQKTDNKSGGFRVVIDEWMKGDINGGGAEIAMKNYNGDMYIRKKK